jgi:uncharacterized protein
MSILTVVLFENHNYALGQTTGSFKDYNKTNNNYFNNTLLVSGTALAKIKPDLVTISIGVETTNKTAKDALFSNSLLMDKVISVLKYNGVKDNEISTSQYTINPNYNYSQSGNILDIIGFSVTNDLKIQSMNLNNTAVWIDSAVDSGANTISSIGFEVSNKTLDNIKNQLIKNAIANAKQKAIVASLAAGLKIIGIKSIIVDSDESNQPPSFNNVFKPRSTISNTATATNTNTTIMPGELEVVESVNIVYLLQ